MNIDIAKIKERLYATEEEYEQILDSSNLSKFRLSWEDGGGENFWGYDLGDNLFVLLNDPIAFYTLDILEGKYAASGRVGYHNNHKVDRKKTIELFTKTKEVVNSYYQNLMDKENTNV